MIKDEQQVQDYVSDHYEEVRYKKSYAKLYQTWWTRKMLSFLTKQDGILLDNGCGIGMLACEMPDHQHAYGVDLSFGMLSKAKTRWNNVIQGNSQKLPFKNNLFDCIINRSLLHHLPDIETGVKEIHRVLKPGGEIVIVDTNESFLSYLPRKIAAKGDHFSDDHQNLNAKDLITLLKKYFSVDLVYYFGYFAYPFGFPDIIDLGKKIPFSCTVTKMLIYVDQLISMLPILNRQSWGIMIKATKKG